MEFQEQLADFFRELGTGREMVLSTSLNDVVTSRMMSFVIMKEKFYFQTDKTFRKYDQIMGNANVALCVANIQVEGLCREAGIPLENEEFSKAYEKNFSGSFNRYSSLKNERLFVVDPVFIQRWIYIDGAPYIETFDVKRKRHTLTPYRGI